MNVLVIPEDYTKDGVVLKPIVSAIMRKVGQARAEVRICQNPRLSGIGQALKWENQEAIIRRYPMTDLFILCVDRDGDERRRERLNHLEQRAAGILREDRLFLAVEAWQEVEVWLLAGLSDLPGEWDWRDVRGERDPKEVYFEVLAHSRSLLMLPDNGRGLLAQEAAKRYERIRQLCPEDVRDLEERVSAWLNSLGWRSRSR